jgi:hypothetical protein
VARRKYGKAMQKKRRKSHYMEAEKLEQLLNVRREQE